jgi:hypothetical protein
VLQDAVPEFYAEFSKGVHPQTVQEKALPLDRASRLTSEVIGSWRAHLNVTREFIPDFTCLKGVKH